MKIISRQSFSFTQESLTLFNAFKADFLKRFGKTKMYNTEVFVRILHETNNLKNYVKPVEIATPIVINTEIKLSAADRLKILFGATLKTSIDLTVNRNVEVLSVTPFSTVGEIETKARVRLSEAFVNGLFKNLT